MKNKRNILVVINLLFLLIVGLWISGVIPKQVGKIAAIKYVNDNYSDKELIFKKMEFSSAHGNYFAVFKDNDGSVYNFLLSPNFYPTTVLYDPINPPG